MDTTTLGILQFVAQHYLQTNIRSLLILHCWPKQTQYVLSQMLSQNYMFSQFQQISGGLCQIDDFRAVYLEHWQPVLGIFFDFNCEHSAEFLNKCQSLRLFNEHFRWLIYDDRANISGFRQLFRMANLAIDADLTYVTLLNSTLTLYDVYSNGHHIGGKLNMTADRALHCIDSSCQLQQYLSDIYKRSKYGNRCSLSDITMRMSTLVTKRSLNLKESELLEFLTSTDDRAVDGIQRFGFQLNQYLIEYLNTNVEYHFTDRWSTGEIFGGAIGELINGTADLCSAPFILTPPRSKYLSVLIETGSFRSICMFRTPRNTDIQGGVFLQPFSTAVWLIFGLVLFSAAALLWRTFGVEQRRMRYAGSYVPSLLSSCLMAFGSACSQGTHLIPRSNGGRMTFFWLSTISYIMYNYYTSMVVSSLLGSPIKSNIRTLGHLADSSLSVALEPLSYTRVYLNTSRLEEVRHFVKRKIETQNNSPSLWLPVEEGIKRVRDQPGFVYIFEASTGYDYVERFYEPHEICDLNEFMLRAEHSIYTQLPRNSSYKEIVRLRTLRLLETGVYLKLHRYWIRTRLHCFSNNHVIDVGMEYAAPLFFMLMVTYLVVLIVLLIELAVNHYMSDWHGGAFMEQLLIE